MSPPPSPPTPTADAVAEALERAQAARAGGVAAAVPHAAAADEIAAGLEDPAPRVLTLALLLELAIEAGDLQPAAVLADLLARQAERAREPGLGAASAATAAELWLSSDRPGDALGAAQEAHRLAARLEAGDSGRLRARAFLAEGRALRALGRDREAAARLRSALALGAEASDLLRTELGLARVRLGEVGADVLAELRDLAQCAAPNLRDAAGLGALEYCLRTGALAQARALLAELGRLDADPDAALPLARACLECGDLPRALALSATLAAARPEWHGAALCRGAVLAAAGRPDEARAALREAERLARAQDHPSGVAEALCRQAELSLGQADPTAARTLARQAAQAAGADATSLASAEAVLGWAALALGQTQDGLDALERAVTTLREAGQLLGAAQVGLLQALADPGSPHHDRLIADAVRSGHRRLQGWAQVALALAAHREGQAARAEALLDSAEAIDRHAGADLGHLIRAAREHLGLVSQAS